MDGCKLAAPLVETDVKVCAVELAVKPPPSATDSTMSPTLKSGNREAFG